MDEHARRAAVTHRSTQVGAETAIDAYRTGIEVEQKTGKTDVVTAADRRAQRRVIDVIQESFPDETIVGEEEDAHKAVPAEGPAWVIDPIDGTNNYVREIDHWATAVAAVVDGEPVAAAIHAPALADTYGSGPEPPTRNGDQIRVNTVSDPGRATVVPTVWWGQDRRTEYARACEGVVTRFGDLRRFGSAQLALALVASGSIEAAITNVETNPWDTVAGVHLIRQAGGRVTDLDGARWQHDSRGIVASNGELHDQVLTAATEIDGPERA
ncbi:MAG: archaeal fructose-1,6-bisphosphatase related enzymes of inositol monophosphatase family [Halorubrum sp. J07HR59]|nr:MAG: archaeal fructose-1,6-bisphosphatase related enzymes of inositol monophosphatase family [Halorubrum sp. J07HR59]